MIRQLNRRASVFFFIHKVNKNMQTRRRAGGDWKQTDASRKRTAGAEITSSDSAVLVLRSVEY
jgi:hypothetical protein